jgi:GTP cyclohydrolase II
VPDGRRLPLAALRLWLAASQGDGAHRRGRARRGGLPRPGRTRDRPAQQTEAYELQDAGHDTVEANEKLGFAPDLRNYGIGAQILLDLGVRRIRVLTNNPKKLVGLGGYDLEIVDRVHLSAPPTDENSGYLDAKRDKLGHLLST